MKKFTEFQVSIIKKGLSDLKDSLLNRCVALNNSVSYDDTSGRAWCTKQVDTWFKTVDEIDNILNSDFNSSDEKPLNFLVVKLLVDYTNGEKQFIPVASFESEQLAYNFVDYMETISDDTYLVDL